LNVSFEPTDNLTVNVGADNLFDKEPPRPTNAGTFNTYPDTYNVVGRTIGVSLTSRW
jgi:outer membrane receptor protein involved in Fe transport